MAVPGEGLNEQSWLGELRENFETEYATHDAFLRPMEEGGYRYHSSVAGSREQLERQRAAFEHDMGAATEWQDVLAQLGEAAPAWLPQVLQAEAAAATQRLQDRYTAYQAQATARA